MNIIQAGIEMEAYMKSPEYAKHREAIEAYKQQHRKAQQNTPTPSTSDESFQTGQKGR